MVCLSPLLYIPHKAHIYQTTLTVQLSHSVRSGTGTSNLSQNYWYCSSILIYYYYFSKFILFTYKHFAISVYWIHTLKLRTKSFYIIAGLNICHDNFSTYSTKILWFLTLLESQPMYPTCPSCICCRKSALDELPVQGVVTTSLTS